MNCDVCNSTITDDNSTRVPTEKFRQLLARGFGINETNVQMLTDVGLSRPDAIEMLSQEYLASQSDWLLCANCFTKAESNLNS
jgi:hypothetical protein